MSASPARWAAALVGLALGAAGVATAATVKAAPEAAATSGASPIVQRGEYVARAADCMTCHTAAGAKPYSGGAALVSAFGKLYPPNITTDAETGIGQWTQDEFTRALRQGVGKHGEPLYPAMPYDSYTKMSDDDVAALWAYLRTVPAVRHTVPANTMRFPTNLRYGLVVWQSAFFKAGRYAPVPERGEAWNRGAYLVEALAHCSACHTPRNAAQAVDESRHLSGAQIEGWYAPDISSDAGSKLGEMSVDDLKGFLKTGHTKGNVKTFGPMQEVSHTSLAYLSDADLLAMATYLKDQPKLDAPAGSLPQAKASAFVAPERLAAGQQIYAAQCSGCHQANGGGIQGTVPALAGNAAVTAREPYNVVSAMLQGFQPENGWGAMASFADALSDEQIADVANYVRNSWGNQGERAATAWSVEPLRLTDGPPPKGDNAALICPALPRAELQAAAGTAPGALMQSARDPAKLDAVVARYRAARPKATNAEIVLATSAAFCRAVAATGESTVRTSARVADFSQQVANHLAQRKTVSSAAKPSEVTTTR